MAGDVMAALESLRPAFEAPADLVGDLQNGAEPRGDRDHGSSSRPWREDA